jgi:excisionase family DNA binding protein
MKNFLTPKEAAHELGINYPALLARIRKGTIKAEKFGWALMVPKKEISKHKKKKPS